MIQFFQATSKVQKDRHVMRETDERMAKYSRRGLVFNFIAFMVCLVGGRFVQENRELTVVLATGLLLITFLRGFYLFRFEQLYPRGPARWRNAYFIVTLIGACWWAFILVSITLVLGLEYETPLLWLYTVVFFSTTAHAFAPYHKFLSHYQFFGTIPAAAAAFVVGGVNGYLYGSLMFVFYLILSHQCRLISDNYWEKLEAGYALGKRAISDEQEKMDNRATLSLSKEFLVNLDKELNESLIEREEGGGQSQILWTKLKVLQENIGLYKDVITRKLEIQNRIFNIRHELQYLVSEFIDIAEKRSIQIETSLSPNLPMRLKGDPFRFAQIVRTLLSQVISTSKATVVILEVQFLREYESAGELYVSVRRMKNKSGIQFFGEQPKDDTPKSLALTTAKGLAELMDGGIDIILSPNNDYQIRFNARLDIGDHVGQLDFHKDRFSGEQIMLVSSNPAIVDLKRQELDALGFTISTETHLKRVTSSLLSQIKSGNVIENVLIYFEPDNEQHTALLKELSDTDELKAINKIIAVSPDAQEQLEHNGFNREEGFYFVPKPLGLFELESTFDDIYAEKGDEEQQTKCNEGTIVVVKNDCSSKNLMDACKELKAQTVVEVDADDLAKTLAQTKNVLVVIPCNKDSNLEEHVETIRKCEKELSENDSFIPIIGVGENCSESDVSAFETGFDDYFDLSTKSGKKLASTLRYWRSLDLS